MRGLVHVEAAINIQRLAGDVSGVLADEEGDGCCDVARGSDAVDHKVLGEFVLSFLAERSAHDVGVDGAGRDGVDGDVVLPQLSGGGAGQTDDACLGHRVGGFGERPAATLGGNGGDVHDAADAVLHHGLGDAARSVVDAVEVDVQDAVPFRCLKFEVRDGRADASHVGEGNDLGQLRLDGIDGRAYGCFVGHVGSDAVGLHTVLAGDFLGGCLAQGVVQVDDANVPAKLCQVVCRGTADAAFGDGSGDDDGSL